MTWLKGQAFSFYRSCGAAQCTRYDTLVGLLTERFTPVRIQSVRSSLFHDRRQSLQESVDAYAQELKRLFYKAYPKASQSHSKTDRLGRYDRSSQFIAGLQPRLKSTGAGSDGGFEQLWVKAHFEQAKIRGLQKVNPSGQGLKKWTNTT